MAEEKTPPVEGTPEEEGKQEEVVVKKLTEIEQRAAAQGWVPQDEWEGDPDQWRPAKEFIDRGELFKKIDDQNRTIKEFKKTLEEFAKHHERVKKVEYERALADLKAQKKEALNEGDADAVVELDEKLAMVREAQKEADKPITVPEAPVDVNPMFQAWLDRNSWYNSNAAMRAYADRLGSELAARRELSPTDALAQIEREVKKEFAHKFINPNREKPGAVEVSTNKGGKSKDTFTLTREEEIAMEKFIKVIPGFSKEKYIEEIKKVRS